MNRSQLVEEIASTTGLTKRQAEEAVDAFVGTIGDQVRSGTKVTIYGFGSFNPTSRKARTGRNPRTGQPVKIAASKGIRFSPATGFKADLNTKKAAAKKAAPAKKAVPRAAAKAPAARRPPVPQPQSCQGRPGSQGVQGRCGQNDRSQSRRREGRSPGGLAARPRRSLQR